MVPDSLLAALPTARASRENRAATDDEVVLVVAGSHRYHHSECPLTADREARALPFHEASAQGLAPCGICAGVAGASTP
jgi:hypothetical protein